MRHKFPPSWSTRSFKEVAEVVTGTTPPTNQPHYYGSFVPFLGPAELGGTEPITQSPKGLSDQGAKQARLLPAESVLVCCIGATIGKVGFSGTELATNQQINALVCDQDVVFPRFVFHYCRTLETLIRHHGASTTLPLLPKGRFQELEIPVPPIAEQKRIAAILDKAEELRGLRRQSLGELDTITQSIFLEMFGDPEKNPKAWAEHELQKVVKQGTIVTYGIVQAGEEFPGGVPYIRTGDIADGEIKLPELRRTDPQIAAKFDRSKVDAGDIVMSIRATVGTTALVPSSLEGANLTQGTARIAPGDKIERLYLLNFLRATGTQHWIARQVKGATFREITLARLRELPVLLPPLSLQQEFARRVEAIEQLKATHRETLAHLDALFASLQHRAFRGEL